MSELSFTQLGQAIRQVFIESDKYQLDKYVPVFSVNGDYFGDCFNLTMMETQVDKPPIFYHTFSPYDVVSKKAPDQALVFQGGELILNIDFADYVTLRTAVMSSLVLSALDVTELGDKKLLFVGSGKIAREALRSLKQYYPDLDAVSFVNTRGEDAEFQSVAEKLGVDARPGDLAKLGQCDIIICHTNAKEPVLKPDMRQEVKQGAVILSFVSESFCEVAEEYYDTDEANVLIDWDKTIPEAAELQRAVDQKIADPDKMIRLKDLLTGTKSIDKSKKYTIYRSHGTPMQNLAVLQLLLRGR